MSPSSRAFTGACLVAAWLSAACGSDSDPPPQPPADQTGFTCSQPSQCFTNLDGGVLNGAVVCLDKVTNGYCTHECQSDSDCCAVAGECVTDHPQVCSPFESTGKMYCFLSCEDSALAGAAATDSNAYCSQWAHVGFGCRSTGGGSKNRKVCMP